MSSKAAPSAPVPETILKKRKISDKAKAKRAATIAAARTLKAKKHLDIFKRAEKYVQEYRKAEQSLVSARRQAKDGGNFFLEPEAKLVFVVRIRGINGVAPKTRKILQLLRLRQIHNGVFIRVNRATAQMLQLVEPYVTYGYPSLAAVRDLIYKRGYAKINGQRIPITSNSVIEKVLGKYNIICIEDLLHEIYTVGPHFKQANKFLWPFKLTTPRGGYKRKALHFQEGGDAGNREHKISEFIHRIV